MAPPLEVRQQRTGALLSALLGCTCWGINAVAVQFIFDVYRFPPLLLVGIRSPLAGLILYALFRPSFPKAPMRQLVVFAVAGVWLSQSMYFLTIYFSNAATSTLLQFLSLPMIAVYEIVTRRARVTASGVVAVLIATLGTAELAAGRANGTLSLIVNPLALVTGLTVAGTSAYYIIVSKRLLQSSGSIAVTTWSFFLGAMVGIPVGAVSALGYSIPAGEGFAELLGLIFFVSLVGTLLAFLLYFRGLKAITPTEGAIASAMEPITAAVFSFFALHVLLTPFQYIGGVLIIVAVTMIVLKARLPI